MNNSRDPSSWYIVASVWVYFSHPHRNNVPHWGIGLICFSIYFLTTSQIAMFFFLLSNHHISSWWTLHIMKTTNVPSWEFDHLQCFRTYLNCNMKRSRVWGLISTAYYKLLMYLFCHRSTHLSYHTFLTKYTHKTKWVTRMRERERERQTETETERENHQAQCTYSSCRKITP